ncbi:MAG: hypothetical protein ABIQ52_21135 [Vicinamibacterales bacterium]
MKTLSPLALFAFVISIAVPAAAQTPAAAPSPANANVLGTWNATVTTTQGAIPTQLKLRKEGEKIVGTISSDMGEAPVEAQVKGKDVTVWFDFQGQGGTVAIELSGTVDGDAIKGTMGMAGQAAGEWAATRVKETNPAAAAAPSAPAAAPAASTPSLTGTYNVSVELPNMTANPSIALTQTGDKLTGEYVSAQYGKFPITGTVKGTEVTFSFAMSVEGNGLEVTYKGAAAKDGSITGTVAYGDMMSGTFTAKRK